MRGIFHVDNSQYTRCWVEADTGETIDIKQNVNSIRFFEGDDVIVEQGEVNKLIKSAVRDGTIHGTILLSDKMYGKYRKNKYYYKFIPYEKLLPAFLVPYTLSTQFLKKKNNKYACIRFTKWINTHPCGELVSTIGDVNITENTYEYLKESNDIYSHSKHLKDIIRKKLHDKSLEEWHEYMLEKYPIEDRTDTIVFSVDPEGTKDIDDACSICDLDDGKRLLSIYIANVPLWLDTFNIWEELTDNISTLYLPHRNYSMLPDILANDVCSLVEKTRRFAFTMDVFLDKDNSIIQIEWKNTYIYVDSNESYSKIERNEYKNILDITRTLNKNHNSYLPDGIQDSHDMIQYLMTMMNCEIAKICVSNKFGIYRTMRSTDVDLSCIPATLHSLMRVWNSPGGKYTLYAEDEDTLRHDFIGATAYMHITSPIRRIIDIVNMTLYLQNVEHILDSKSFLSKWYTQHSINRINEKAKQIRRVQNECKCIHTMLTSDIHASINYGYVIHSQEQESTIQYNIYLPSLNIVHYIEYDKNIWNIPLKKFYSYKWKMHYIEDDYRIRKRLLLTFIE